eukprot:CAMPEP_0119280648 /NCGR_PEP_ID=MMETSP1329-20130426/23126_1 /TAXON_ID=114041 /ORGANISM="Genus nov. species nov., Strain RCC1024" /LENGTH=115 /DNA_ID=CAMNT_0007281243 /DNA_START=494 /DNA_END=841 /DNA_ORIENTATION=-
MHNSGVLGFSRRSGLHWSRSCHPVNPQKRRGRARRQAQIRGRHVWRPVRPRECNELIRVDFHDPLVAALDLVHPRCHLCRDSVQASEAVSDVDGKVLRGALEARFLGAPAAVDDV